MTAQASLFEAGQQRMEPAEDAPAPIRAPRAKKTPRPFQDEAVKRTLAALGENRSTLVVMPTGTGKTFVGSLVVRDWVGPVLWLAHREELIDQGRADLEEHTGERPGKEKADERAPGRSRIVVGSVQTLRAERLANFAQRLQPTLIVVDEAHHAVAPSYRAILDAFPAAKVLGLTATPDRSDEKAMGQVFDSVAYVYEILQAIKDGWLCRYRFERVQVDAINLAAARTTAGDFNQADLDAAMSVEEVLHGVVKPTLEMAEGRRTIMFTTSVANAHRMAEIFNRYRANSAKAVDGETPTEERGRILRSHKDGEYQFLCNVGVLTEGYDDPAVSCIGMARPTKSRALYAQMAGRGFRICAGKDKLLLLDFVGNTGKHRLVTGADILDGKYDDEVTAKAREISERDGQIDAVEALETAAAQIAEDRAREAAKRARIQAKVKYSSRQVDPFEVLHIAHDEQDGVDERFGLVATEKQRETLTKAGIDVPVDCSRARASKLIGSIFKRRELGLASFKQLKTLQKYGIAKINVGFQQASAVIDAIAGNGWRGLPPGQLEALLARSPGEDG